ncbi:MAG: hypothetical protein HKN45_11915 [Flavobacteriales bacterium]|nr:hypothetical protein [Flavobacteriales bacterium]
MRLSLMLSIAFLSLTLACSQKSVQETPVAEEPEVSEVEKDVTDTKMEFDGYKKGIVLENTELSAPCDYRIKIGESMMIESLNFPEEFEIDGLEVWVKYSLQRRSAQCLGAQPAEIIDIKKIGD